MKAILLFIVFYLLLNFFVFLPNWFLGFFNNKTQTVKLQNNSLWQIVKYFLFKRFTNDFIRLSPEIALVFLILIFFKVSVGISQFILSVFTTILFLYHLYILSIIKIYKRRPCVFSDFKLIQTGMMFFKIKIPVLIIGLLFILSLLLGLSFGLSYFIFKSMIQIENPIFIFLILSLITFISIASLKNFQYDKYHSVVFFSSLVHFKCNFNKSKKLIERISQIDYKNVIEVYSDIKLKIKPNIFLIFIESYGEIVLSHSKFGHEILSLLKKNETILDQNNWHTASTLSYSPISSGASWLAHASVLYGRKINNDTLYNQLFSHSKYTSNFKSLTSVLNANNYETVLTNSISHDTDEINWNKINNCYRTENIFLFDDLNYKGKTLSFLNRQPIPDEWSLNISYEKLKERQPFFLQLNTTNSHSNFHSPVKPGDHWKDYQENNFETTEVSKKNLELNYFKAIKYQLKYINKFITNQNPKNSIFILIGDHQPPLITPDDSERLAPIHIISKDKNFIDEFRNFEYNPGMIPEKKTTQKYESFLSKFLFSLNKIYGYDKTLNLPINDEGLDLF